LSFDEVAKLQKMIQYFDANSDIFPAITGLVYYYQENEVHVFSGSRLLLPLD